MDRQETKDLIQSKKSVIKSKGKNKNIFLLLF